LHWKGGGQIPLHFQHRLPLYDVSLVFCSIISKDVNKTTSEVPSSLLHEKYSTVPRNVSNSMPIYTVSYPRKLEYLLVSLRNKESRWFLL
jgi:hypothetical protein